MASGQWQSNLILRWCDREGKLLKIKPISTLTNIIHPAKHCIEQEKHRPPELWADQGTCGMLIPFQEDSDESRQSFPGLWSELGRVAVSRQAAYAQALLSARADHRHKHLLWISSLGRTQWMEGRRYFKSREKSKGSRVSLDEHLSCCWDMNIKR